MLDYNLVTSKATYRMVTDKDVPVLRSLVRGFYAETPYGRNSGGSIEATVRELDLHKEKGTVFVFESGNRIVGYAILIVYWSNEWGGNILYLDELYIVPEERGKGIAGDFMDLLVKIAPKDTVLLQLEVDAANKGLVKFYKRHGFEATKDCVMTRQIKAQPE